MQPMLGKPFHRSGWVYEEKYDGCRMLAFKDGPRIRLISRQGVDHTERFRELADSDAILYSSSASDGTAVAVLLTAELVRHGGDTDLAPLLLWDALALACSPVAAGGSTQSGLMPHGIGIGSDERPGRAAPTSGPSAAR